VPLFTSGGFGLKNLVLFTSLQWLMLRFDFDSTAVRLLITGH